MPAAQQPVVDGDVHHVPDRVVARAHEVADEPAVDQRRQADARRLGQLEHEHRQRPRRRERPPLDGDHLREVRVGEAPDLELGRSFAAGLCVRELGGSRGAQRPAATAGALAPSRQTCSARTTWALEASGSTRTPAASSISRKRNEPSPAASGATPASRTRSATSSGVAANGGQRSSARALVERGEQLAPARVDQAGAATGPRPCPPPAPRARTRAAARSRPRPRGPLAVAIPIRSPVNAPGAHAHRDRVEVGEAEPGALHRRGHRGHQLGRVGAAAPPAPRRARPRTPRRRRAARTRRWRRWTCRARAGSLDRDPAAVAAHDARGARAPRTRSRRGSAAAGHSTKAIRSGVR